MNDTTYEVHPEIAKGMIPMDDIKSKKEAEEVETQEEQPEPQPVEQAQPSPSANDVAKNFRAIREAKERAERERDELLQRLKQTESRGSESDDIVLRPDDLVEWRHVDKRIKQLEQQLKQSQQQTMEQTIEARLKYQYPDFDQVVNQDTIETLRITHPEIAETLNSSTNLYSKAVSAYTLIKRLGIVQEPEVKQQIAKAHANAAKPKVLASLNPQQGDTPLSKANAFANGLTPDVKKQLWKEMNEYMKNR